MRRPRTALAWILAALVVALSASFLKAQMFRRRSSPPPGPASPVSITTTSASRGPSKLLMNALDYLDNYQDPKRALKYLNEASARRNELAPADQQTLDATILRAQTLIAQQSPASGASGSPSLPPQPERIASQNRPGANSLPPLPALPVLSPVPGEGVVQASAETIASGQPAPVQQITDPAPLPLAQPLAQEPAPMLAPEPVAEAEPFAQEPAPMLAPEPVAEAELPAAEPAPAPQPEPAPAPQPEPASEPIGLTVLTDPADHLAGLGSSAPEPEAAVEQPDPTLDAVPSEAAEPVSEQPEPLPALTAEPAVEAPMAAEPLLPGDLTDAPMADEASAPPALPPLPGPALETEPADALVPPPLAAPGSEYPAVPESDPNAVPVLPPDAGLAAAPVPPNGSMPEDSGLLLSPPVEPMPAQPMPATMPVVRSPSEALPTLPRYEPPPVADAGVSEPPPLELGAPASPEMPATSPVVEPPPAPDASELPGIDLSSLGRERGDSSGSVRASAPIVDPAPEAQLQPQPVSPPAYPVQEAQAPAPLPQPEPEPIQQTQAAAPEPEAAPMPRQAPVTPPSPAPAPAVGIARQDLLLDPTSSGAPVPQGTATLSPETMREIEEIARRQEEEAQREASPYNMQPLGPGGLGGPSLGPPPSSSLGGAVEPSGTQAELPRAPSPTEARPIRPIEVPEETVQLPPRVFDPNRKYWASPATCTMPLWFQDAVLERYGQNVEQAMGPAGRFFSYPLDDPTQSNQRMQILQPFYSAGLFALQVAALPYNAVMDPPWEAHYQLGYFRPGDPTPPDLYYLPTTGLGPPLHGKRYGRWWNWKKKKK